MMPRLSHLLLALTLALFLFGLLFLLIILPVKAQVSSSATLVSVSGYNNIKGSDVLVVHGENHSNGSTYDIYLGPYLICSNVPADASDNLDASCDLAPTGILPGFYPLFSTVSGSTSPRIATAPEDVEIVASGDPKILFVEDNTIWAANETTDLKLQFHPASPFPPISDGQPYTVKLFNSDDTEVQVIASGHDGVSTNLIAWTPPAMSDPLCDVASGNLCTIRSYDTNNNLVAEIKVNVNQPKIILTSGVGPYKRGEAVSIFLTDHTPGKRYDIEINPTSITPPDIPPSPLVFSTLETNAAGDTTIPITWIIPGDCGLGTCWPDGLYEVISRPRGQANQIAILENVEILGSNIYLYLPLIIFPPGLQVCTELLDERSFEEVAIVDWKWPGTTPEVPIPGGVARNPSGGNTGTRSLRTKTVDGFPRTPHFWQRVTMPDWILSTTTTLHASFYHRVADLSSFGNQPDDKFYVVLATTDNPLIWTALTDPAEIANGVEIAGWTQKTVPLSVASGVNLEDYQGQDVYLYFYNNSNVWGSCAPNCGTQFDFDDMSLINCTTQPKPSRSN
jgi:hypothetical protein